MVCAGFPALRVSKRPATHGRCRRGFSVRLLDSGHDPGHERQRGRPRRGDPAAAPADRRVRPAAAGGQGRARGAADPDVEPDPDPGPLDPARRRHRARRGPARGVRPRGLRGDRPAHRARPVADVHSSALHRPPRRRARRGLPRHPPDLPRPVLPESEGVEPRVVEVDGSTEQAAWVTATTPPSGSTCSPQPATP